MFRLYAMHLLIHCNRLMAKIGFLISSHGATLSKALSLSSVDREDIYVVCTSPENAIVRNNIEPLAHFKPIQWVSRSTSSVEIAEIFATANVKKVCMLFNRLVDVTLYESLSLWNIHPSLLPAFRGASPITQQLKDRQFFQGCSLHRVDATVDGGPLESQVVMPIDNKLVKDIRYRRHCAYIMKIVLLCNFLDYSRDSNIEWGTLNQFGNILLNPSWLSASSIEGLSIFVNTQYHKFL